MSANEAKALIQRYFDAFNAHDNQGMLDCLSEDVVHDIYYDTTDFVRISMREVVVTLLQALGLKESSPPWPVLREAMAVPSRELQELMVKQLGQLQGQAESARPFLEELARHADPEFRRQAQAVLKQLGNQAKK